MPRQIAIRLDVVAIAIVATNFVARAGTNQTYVNNDSPNVAGYVQLAEPVDYWWANAFTAPAGGVYLTQLDVSFGVGFAVGTPVSVIVYEDPSNFDNPSDLQYITSINGTVSSADGSDLYTPQAFKIPTTYVTGDYFVAVEVDNASASAFGPPVTSTNPVGRGFMALNAGAEVGTMTPTNINNADQPPIDLDVLVNGSSTPMYNFFIGARGRATRYAEAQDPLVLDGFNTGNFFVSANGIEVSASDAVGGNRIATIATPNGPGSVSVANGALTLTNCQATIAYGAQYTGGSGYQSSATSYVHANLGGYDTLQFHFLESNSPILIGNFGAASPTSYTTDANGNIDFSLAGMDWTDFTTYSFTVYSYNQTISLDSITLLTNPIPGDVNGDGLLNGDDYALINYGYAAQLTGHVYGDLNGDGVINAADFLIIDTAFSQEYGLSPSLLGQRQAEFGSAYVAELQAAVPEPTLLAACGLALPLLIRRRPRI